MVYLPDSDSQLKHAVHAQNKVLTNLQFTTNNIEIYKYIDADESKWCFVHVQWSELSANTVHLLQLSQDALRLCAQSLLQVVTHCSWS